MFSSLRITESAKTPHIARMRPLHRHVLVGALIERHPRERPPEHPQTGHFRLQTVPGAPNNETAQRHGPVSLRRGPDETRKLPKRDLQTLQQRMFGFQAVQEDARGELVGADYGKRADVAAGAVRTAQLPFAAERERRRGPHRDSGQQPGEVQARTHLSLLRKVLLEEVRLEDPHQDAHGVQALEVQVLHEALRRSEQSEQARQAARRGEHSV
jgi:hypothetical protein